MRRVDIERIPCPIAVPEEARVWAHPVERTARGRAYRQILTAADDEQAGLIVMGVRGKVMTRPRHILVPSDFSDEANAAKVYATT
jgi:hypothetical protein